MPGLGNNLNCCCKRRNNPKLMESDTKQFKLQQITSVDEAVNPYRQSRLLVMGQYKLHCYPCFHLIGNLCVTHWQTELSIDCTVRFQTRGTVWISCIKTASGTKPLCCLCERILLQACSYEGKSFAKNNAVLQYQFSRRKVCECCFCCCWDK